MIMNTDILNVVLQLIEGAIAFEFLESINPSRKKLKNFFIITVSYMIMCGINLWLDYNFFINLTTLITFHLIFNKALYKNKLGLSMVNSGLFAVFVCAGEYVSLLMLSVFSDKDVYAILEIPSMYIIMIVFSKSILFIGMKVVSMIFNKIALKQGISVITFIFPISLLVIMSAIVASSRYVVYSDLTKILFSGASFFMITAVIVTCILQQREAEREQELIELRAIKQNQETDNKYFEILEHQNKNLMMYAHDTKNHLIAIRSLTDDEKIISYIEKLTDGINKYSKLASSGNHSLDVIINKYITECEIKNVKFTYDIKKSNLFNIEIYDMVTILGNLLDNALEAAETSKEKFIHLQTERKNGYDIVTIKNSCDKKPQTDGDKLKTTKTNKRFHGLGIKSIKTALKKYNGDYNWEYNEKEKTFSATVTFLS